MATKEKQANGSVRTEQRGNRITKKDQIIALYTSGITDVGDLAIITHSRPSYVASVLQQAQQLRGYFDLYTSSKRPMNVYSKFFAGKLGFKDEEAARHSIELIDHFYRQFELAQDRAGQHHALLMALTMFDRARWTGKEQEADIFRRWLVDQLTSDEPGDGTNALSTTPTLPFRGEVNRETRSRQAGSTVRR
jgi:hypothetical protein